MKSGWVINFNNGYRVILSEKMYKDKYLKETPREDVRVEEHWFDMKKAIANYPDTDLVE